MLVQICEPIVSQSIYPHINQLLRELNIAPIKIGYYVLESIFFITEATTALQWSRASDRVGRKKNLLIGLFGTALSMLCFGLSQTFWVFVLSRCLTGLLNGNTGVMKSVMGDLTDASNRAEGFAYLPVVWAAGASLGPLIRGSLSHPHERFPETFPGLFWSSFLYFLPCAATGAVILSTFVVVLVLFKEVCNYFIPTEESFIDRQVDWLLPLRDLLTVPVVILVSNYVALGFLHMTFGALLPLFLGMPVELGGLGLSPSKIGLILAVDGAVTGIFQIRFGEHRVFMNGLAAFLPIFAIFPVMSIVARWPGWNPVVWILVGCLIALDVLMNPSYALKCSRGTINGISQTSALVARAVGPALATSLFSLSAAHNILGGYIVYAVLIFNWLATLR
ncbi:major facilitator superfamily domain-containing protein [Mycena vulgaris]|nr:major facilitator superfamily domain-containing protein [Mycena vulgaris]